MGAINKEVYYCSKPELATFRNVFQQDDIREAFLGDLQEDQLDVWFELYRSISANKEHVEHEVEKQIKKRQKIEHRKLLIKRQRLDQVKIAFISRYNKRSAMSEADRRSQRSASAPSHLNQLAEHTKFVREAEEQTRRAEETRAKALGAIDELNNVVMNLVATRYILDVVTGAQNQNQVNPDLLLAVNQALARLQENVEQLPANQQQQPAIQNDMAIQTDEQ